MNKNQYDMISFMIGCVGLILFFGIPMVGVAVPWKEYKTKMSTIVLYVAASVIVVVSYMVGLYLWLGVTPPPRLT